jgi:hypothetical protein
LIRANDSQNHGSNPIPAKWQNDSDLFESLNMRFAHALVIRWVLCCILKTNYIAANGSTISRGIGGQFRITQRSALSSLYENSCCRCKQTISPAVQWYLTCQFKAFVDMQYILNQFCCLSLIKLHVVQGVNNVQNCLIPAFLSLTTKLGRCHPNVCTAETGGQLLTAFYYSKIWWEKDICTFKYCPYIPETEIRV